MDEIRNSRFAVFAALNDSEKMMMVENRYWDWPKGGRPVIRFGAIATEKDGGYPSWEPEKEPGSRKRVRQERQEKLRKDTLCQGSKPKREGNLRRKSIIFNALRELVLLVF